ncbi:MAG: Xaa-Pro aminopeptidase (EC [uncultured Aureispira sp.]|uniref:Xaa-Pro aminopeptidase (EC) n=1 Tax=uncultured Aureispira sp. TaxID=1331704 RepID=A0A6S6SFK8_9BACT|nr:MAG: Xaa-Pro aminopeptidase (EC [uncultured Aureispira sp.]
MSIKKRLEALRVAMKSEGIDAFIIPANDPHQSEYVAEHWKVRTYFSGFTGSAGLLVVLADYAALWTDFRYFLQAETELEGTGIVLHKQQVQHAPEHVEWLCDLLPENATIGIEGRLFSLEQVAYLESYSNPKGIQIKDVQRISGRVWKDRPALPDTIAYEHDVQYNGMHRDEKIANLRAEMKKKGAQHYLISGLDEIAWMLNIRAWDIDYTPVVLSYLLVSTEKVTLFIKDYKVPQVLKDKLKASAVSLKDYIGVSTALKIIPKSETIFVDKNNFSWSFVPSIKATLIKGMSLVMPMMAIKNETEIKHSRSVMVKDGIALTRFFKWLEKTIENKTLKETDVSKKLSGFRSQQDLYKGDSFAAIVGYKSNGAIVHYHAEEATCATIENEGMLLIDSGGQYLDGTTDITRTICFGTPTEEQKRHYTLVLKGNIALQNVHFPKGTTGVQLDVLARMNLWNEGLNYGHGTGHGVGFFLRVHEPPQGFADSMVTLRGSTAMEEGMITSNEPGFYKTGAYGIRIENLMLCVPSSKNKDFLAFESITLFPIETKLIDLSLMSPLDIAWLNKYHQRVYAALSPSLNGEEKAWLWSKCETIG